MKNRKIFLVLAIISLVLVVLTAIMIFYFSSESGEQSTQTSNGVTTVVIEVTQPDYQTLPVEKQQERFQLTSAIVRKIAHFSEFFMLGLFSILALKFFELYKNRKIKFSYLFALIFSILYAASDEIHQIISDNRGPSFIDVLIDSSGSILAILAVFIVFLLINKHQTIKHLEQA